MTLLKNEGNVLPLAKGRKVLVTGPTANKLSVLNGGWSTTWQGDQEQLYPQEKNTILEAVQEKLGQRERHLRRGRGVRQGDRYRQGRRGRGATSMRSSPASANRRIARRRAISTI